jgi:hypothetical protein
MGARESASRRMRMSRSRRCASSDLSRRMVMPARELLSRWPSIRIVSWHATLLAGGVAPTAATGHTRTYSSPAPSSTNRHGRALHADDLCGANGLPSLGAQATHRQSPCPARRAHRAAFTWGPKEASGPRLQCSTMTFRTTKRTTGRYLPLTSSNGPPCDCAVFQLLPRHGRGGFRTCDLSRVKRAVRTS